MKTRSTKFLFSSKHSTESGARKIEAVRAVVKSANAQAREVGSPVRLSVQLSPRWGKKSESAHAWKYENKDMAGRRWRLEDADHVDVYLVRRG